MRFLSACTPAAILLHLFKGKESSTFRRLLQSQHVVDLRLIFQLTVLVMVFAPVLALIFCALHESIASWSDVFAAIANSGLFIGAIWTIGGGVIAWTYQAGSARLGVVDLFACEIATLCRVTVVVDTVQHFIELGEQLPRDTTHFSSQEEYFPVFASTVKDLQQLEETVVKDVTAFYTYMKVMRDYLRKLSDIQPDTSGALKIWHSAVTNIIYMLFLGLESARLSIEALVEFQPTQAEEKITILLSEITAYGHLRDTVTDDLLSRRLQAREPEYHKVIVDLDKLVRENEGVDWKNARGIIGDLMRRYAQVFPIEAPVAVREPVMA